MWIEGDGWCKSTRTFSRTPIGQVVKTSPFHGENTSSNLVWVIDLQLVKDTYTSGRRRLMLNYGIQRSVSIFRFRGVVVNMLACHARERGFDSRRNRYHGN